MRVRRWGIWPAILFLLAVTQLTVAFSDDAPRIATDGEHASPLNYLSARSLLRNKEKNSKKNITREAAPLQASTIEAEPRIAGGQDAPCGRYSYMVSLRDSQNHHKCGGVLVSQHWVITAAHCVDPKDRSSLGPMPLIVIGACNLNDRTNEGGDVEMLLPVKTIIYEGWTGEVLEGGDLALLKLGKDSNHTPIALPSAQHTASTSDPLTVLGWGQNLEGDAPVELHMGSNMQVVPNEICRSGSVWGGVINEKMICAFALHFEGDTCEGDSGGPILRAFAPNGDLSGGMPDLDVLIGITSFGEKGKECGESLIPGVYTAVGQYGDWIKRQMEEDFETEGAPSPSEQTVDDDDDDDDDDDEVKQDDDYLQDSHSQDDDEGREHEHEEEEGEEEAAEDSPRAPTRSHSYSHASPAESEDYSPDMRIKLHRRPDPDSKPESPPPPQSPSEAAVPHLIALPTGTGKPALRPTEQNSKPVKDTRGRFKELIALATKGENPSTKASIDRLLSKGADPSACCDSLGRSALHAASTKDNDVAAVALITAGAYVDKMDDQGQTPLHLAAVRNAPRVAQVLVDAGATINAKDVDGETPLHDAAERGYWKVAEILLKAGADRFMVDTKGRTPRDSVCSNGCGRNRQEKKLNDLLES